MLNSEFVLSRFKSWFPPQVSWLGDFKELLTFLSQVPHLCNGPTCVCPIECNNPIGPLIAFSELIGANCIEYFWHIVVLRLHLINVGSFFNGTSCPSQTTRCTFSSLCFLQDTDDYQNYLAYMTTYWPTTPGDCKLYKRFHCIVTL